MSEIFATVVILAFNEELQLGPTLEEVDKATADLDDSFEILIIDDGSTDGTADVARLYAADDPSIRLIQHATNRGIGAACITGIDQARGMRVLLMPGDNSYSSVDIAAVLKASKSVDVVSGVRLANTAITRRRRLLSRLLRINGLLLGGRWSIDIGGLNVYDRSLLRKSVAAEDGYFFVFETVVAIGRLRPSIGKIRVAQLPDSGLRSNSASLKRVPELIASNVRLVKVWARP